MLAAIVALWRGFVGRCPVCGRGRMFRSFYTLIEGCALCGRRYEGMGNQNTGAMGISVTLTTLLGFIGGFLLVLYVPDQLVLGLVCLFVLLTIFHAIFYRLARGLWIGLLSITGAMDEDERRDEFFL